MNAAPRAVLFDAPDLSAGQRIRHYHWDTIEAELDAQGDAVLERLLTPEECTQIAALYSHEEHFRSRVVMARHGFGKGEYRYFSDPLPALLEELRKALYARLVPSQMPGTSGWACTIVTPLRKPNF